MREKLNAGLENAGTLLEEVLPKCSDLSFPSSMLRCKELGPLQMLHSIQKLYF